VAAEVNVMVDKVDGRGGRAGLCGTWVEVPGEYFAEDLLMLSCSWEGGQECTGGGRVAG